MALVLTRLVRSNYDELDNIPIIHQDLTVSFTKQADTYYIHTGSTTPLYTKGRMYYCDGTNLKKVVIVDELPKVNDGKLTITVNGTAHTFTANQAGDTSFSITDTHYTNYLQIKGNNTEAVKFTQNADKSLNLKPGNNVSISATSGEITISATDTNTWRGIQDNLTSDSATDSLSAKQGKELKKLVDGKSDSGHTHNYAGSSSAGGTANSAKELGMLFYKASERAGAEGYYKIATITHKTWSYCSFTMFTANSYSGAKFNTLFDVRCSDNANSLNGFAFNIIGGTDISNKLKYLETKSGDNITKIEIFMKCSRYEHPKFYLVTSSTSNGLAINTTDWGDTPDKASSTTMTGSAANTIKAAALTVSAGSATKPIYFNDGVPTACNYTLEKSVPSDAVFTDTNTHNSHAIISGTKSDNSTQIKGSASSGDIILGDSGASAGSYGNASNQEPGYGTTFNVPYITVNAKGIVTAISNKTVKIPAAYVLPSANSDRLGGIKIGFSNGILTISTQ